MLFGVKFREKGEKEYISMIIDAKDEDECNDKFVKFVSEPFGSVPRYDVDKRTLSWAGSSFPLSHNGIVTVSGKLEDIDH